MSRGVIGGALALALASVAPAGVPELLELCAGPAPPVLLRAGTVLERGVLPDELSAPGVEGVALAAAELDGDGVTDVIALYRSGDGSGGLLAVFPGEARARRSLDVVAPLRPPSRVHELPQTMDLMGIGDFDRDGCVDVVVARRGADALWWLPGDGDGGFGAVRRHSLPGALTALATGEVNRRDGLADLVVGVGGAEGSALLVYQSGAGALLSEPERVSLPHPANEIVLEKLDGDPARDVAVAAGGAVLLVSGEDRLFSRERLTAARIWSATGEAADGAVTLAAGDFLDEGEGALRRELAVATADGQVRILGPGGPGEGSAWQAISNAEVLNDGGPGEPGALLSVRWPGASAHGLAHLGRGTRDLVRLIPLEGGSALARDSLELAVPPVVAVALRLNGDALDDLVLLGRGEAMPRVLLSAPRSTFTVDDTGDEGDLDTGDGICDADDGDGVICTLRAAIEQANAVGDADLVNFDIPAAPGEVPVISPASLLPTVTGPVTIDGTTQGAGFVKLEGPGTSFDGVTVSGGLSTLRGLVISSFNIALELFSNSNVVEGCRIGTDAAGVTGEQRGGLRVQGAFNQIGGPAAGAGNLIACANPVIGIAGAAASSNTLQGNLIGTDASGTYALCGSTGVEVASGAAGTVLGGAAAGEGNLISGHILSLRYGFEAKESSDTLVQGNLIGTEVTGTAAIPSVFCGIKMTWTTATTVTIGGTAPGAGNLISGHSSVGLELDLGSGNAILGNLIGTDITGTQPIPNLRGLSKSFHGLDVLVGGTGPGEGNVIAFNLTSGVFDGWNAGYNPIRGNSIHSNQGLGIDLDSDGGVTPNDPNDTDWFQNLPVLTAVSSGSTHITGTLASRADTTYDIDFYSNSSCDPTGYGEGEFFIGSTQTTTDSSGDAAFEVTLPVTVPDGHVITATATHPGGRTSEFSACTAPLGDDTDLALAMTDSADPVSSGDRLSYELTVTNNGALATPGVLLTDILPPEVTFVAATPGYPTCSESARTVSCSLGELDPAETFDVTIEVQVSAAFDGSLSNPASVTGSLPESDPDDNTASETTTVVPAIFVDGFESGDTAAWSP